MSNWCLLDKIEYTKAWNFVYDELHFNPNMDGKELIQLKEPNEFYDIAGFYNEGFSQEIYDNLHASALTCFLQISKGKRLYALNWQHECYSFSPELPFEKDEFEEWLISVFPNGDYIFFLSKDFNNGLFGDGFECSITLFGEEMVKSFNENKPYIFLKNQ